VESVLQSPVSAARPGHRRLDSLGPRFLSDAGESGLRHAWPPPTRSRHLALGSLDQVGDPIRL
jgi:hypothetical protein